MSIGVFSDFRSGSAPQQVTVKNEVKKDNQTPVIQSNQTGSKISDAIKTYAPVAATLIGIPATAIITYKCSQKGINSLSAKVDELAKNAATAELAKEVEALKESHAKVLKAIKSSNKGHHKAQVAIWTALAGAAGVAVGTNTPEITSALSGRINDTQNTANSAMNEALKKSSASGNQLIKKYIDTYYGIPLLINSDSSSKDQTKYENAIKHIQNAAAKYLYEAPNVKPISANPATIWSVTSEFDPIKEGGLGSVPVQVQNNVTKLGIDIPTFIPMYQDGNKASFKKDGDKYVYAYGTGKSRKQFELEKLASFKLDTYQDGNSKTEEVEFYVNTETIDGHEKKLIFVKNDHYFNGSIYATGAKSEEPEKFAFFSKAVYEFAKAKFDEDSVKGLNIPNRQLFDSIKAPDAMILNDWQASPIAALARYKAPVENAYNKLSDDAANKLKDMTIVTIGHNTKYQGSTQGCGDTERRVLTSNILNTLFDHYTFDIVNNAYTKSTEKYTNDSGLKNVDNVLLLDRENSSLNNTNLLNMGICLSNYFHPVSQNYAKEIISNEHSDLSGAVRWALNQKNKSGSLVGIINGNDFNSISIKGKENKIINDTDLHPKLYDKNSDIEAIMLARLDNKINFYNNFLIPLSKKKDENNHDNNVDAIRNKTKDMEFVHINDDIKLPELSDEDLAVTPIISSVGRLVSQKGIPVMTGAIEMLFKNWDSEFPNKPKPIFFIGGKDGEGGKQREIIETFLKNLNKEDANRVAFSHGYAPMPAIASSSDFFMLPSMFEPCGLTQSEAFALGTPVVANSVGGIVDTVNRNGLKNGFLAQPSIEPTSENFYKVLVEALHTYFDDKEAYKNMVKDAISEDFSWIQKGKVGPVFDYLTRLGIDVDSLPELCK